jgi:hypothetical protein
LITLCVSSCVWPYVYVLYIKPHTSIMTNMIEALQDSQFGTTLHRAFPCTRETSCASSRRPRTGRFLEGARCDLLNSPLRETRALLPLPTLKGSARANSGTGRRRLEFILFVPTTLDVSGAPAVPWACIYAMHPPYPCSWGCPGAHGQPPLWTCALRSTAACAILTVRCLWCTGP